MSLLEKSIGGRRMACVKPAVGREQILSIIIITILRKKVLICSIFWILFTMFKKNVCVQFICGYRINTYKI